MPLVFPVVLLLILGAVTLVSRTSSSLMVASKQSDAQAARQAAESGMNRVLSALNPFAKNAGDPYLSFLLLSKWEDGKGVNGSGWRLTTDSNTKGILRNCRISSKGVNDQEIPPANSALFEKLISGEIRSGASKERTLRYRLIGYKPPENPIFQDKRPSQCKDFASITGGTGRITVEGTVEKNGKILARNRLSRTIEVETVPIPDVPALFYQAYSPGPPNSLRIKGSAKGLGSVKSYWYVDIDSDKDPVLLPTASTDLLRPQCQSASCPRGGASTPTNGATNYFPTNDTDLPPLSVLKDPSVEPSDFTPISPDFIIVSPAISPPPPPPSCYKQLNPVNPGVRDCVITPATLATLPTPTGTLGTTYTPPIVTVQVDTSGGPVNLWLTTDLGGPPIPPPAGSKPGDPLPTDDLGRIVIQHCVANCATTSPILYSKEINSNHRSKWNKLRIFSSDSVSLYSSSGNPSSPSLNGAFLWLNKGKLIYGNPTYTYDAVTKTWSKQNEAAPPDILTAWWLNDLDLQLSGTINFIMPLYGNPQALEAFFPGYYCTDDICSDASPIKLDLPQLFPLYPVLPRLRSAF